MDLRLFSIEQAPRNLPFWEAIVADLGKPTAARIGRALDVGTSTVYRWNQSGNAPRVACLALFWLTRWGRSLVDAQATNDALTAAALARSLSDERNQLRGRVSLLTEDHNRLSQVVRRFQALLERERGSAAIADRSRMDTAPADSWVPESWSPEAPLPELALDWPALPSDGQGTPATPPTAAHSARSPSRPRSGRPQPSTGPEVLQSSPLVPPWRHSDASLESLQAPPSDLLELGQAQAAARPGDRSSAVPLIDAPGSGLAASALPRPSPGAAPSGCVVDASRRARQRLSAGRRTAPASSNAAPPSPTVQADEPSAADACSPGAPAPAPACDPFAALVAALR